MITYLPLRIILLKTPLPEKQGLKLDNAIQSTTTTQT